MADPITQQLSEFMGADRAQEISAMARMAAVIISQHGELEALKAAANTPSDEVAARRAAKGGVPPPGEAEA